MKQHIRKLGGQSLIYGLPEVLNNAVTVLLIPVFTFYLKTSDFGILGLMATVRTILSILYKLGLNSAILKQHYDFNTGEERRRYFGSVVTLVLIYNLAVTGLLTAVGFLFIRQPVSGIAFNPYFITVIWAVFFSGLDFVVMIRFRVMDKPLQYSIVSIARFTISIILTLLLIVKYELGAMGRLYAILFTSALFFLVSLFMLRDLTFRPDTRYLKKALAFSIPLLPYFLVTWILSASDKWIINIYKRLAEVGLYSLGYRVASLMRFVITAVSLAVIPYFYSLAAKGKSRDLGRIGTYFAVFMITMALCIATVGKGLIFWITAENYHPAAAVVPILTLAFLFRAMFVFPACAIRYRERTFIMSLVTTGAAVLNVALNFALIPAIGITGAAIATAATMLFMWGVLHFTAQRSYPVQYDFSTIAKAGLIAAVAYGAQAFVPDLHSKPLTWTIRLAIVGAGVLVLTYLFLLRYPRIAEADEIASAQNSHPENFDEQHVE